MKKIFIILLLLNFICFTSFAAVNFDGIDDTIVLSTNANGTPLDAGLKSEWTVACWIKPTGASVHGRPFGWWDGIQDGGIGRTEYLLFINGGVAASGWQNNISHNGYFPTDPAGLSLNTWYHLVGTFKQNGTAKIYVNGVEKDSVAVANEPIYDAPAGRFFIGAGGDAGGGLEDPFEGIVTECAAWDVELTVNEIKLLANSRVKRMPLQIRPANLKVYYPLNDQPDGTSGDGDTFVNRVSPGTVDGTGDNGANNTGLTAKAEEVLSYP